MKKIYVNSLEPSQEQLNSLLECYQTGRYVDAEKLSVSITEEFPKHPIAWKVLGAILKQTGRISESLVICQKSVQLGPQDAGAHNNLGVLLQQLERLDEAEICYRKAIQLKPNYAEVHHNLGTTLRKLGRLEEAETSYNIAVNLKPGSEPILMSRSKIYFDKGMFELSLKDSDNCNNPISRDRSLRSLYALRRIDEIYERIEKNSQLDEMNISVAAFSSFISTKEGKETANNFCRNPLDFIYHSNLKNHLKNSDLFINEIR